MHPLIQIVLSVDTKRSPMTHLTFYPHGCVVPATLPALASCPLRRCMACIAIPRFRIWSLPPIDLGILWSTSRYSARGGLQPQPGISAHRPITRRSRSWRAVIRGTFGSGLTRTSSAAAASPSSVRSGGSPDVCMWAFQFMLASTSRRNLSSTTDSGFFVDVNADPLAPQPLGGYAGSGTARKRV